MTNPSPDEGPALEPHDRDQLDVVRELLASATQRLLGDTIGLADEDWAAPSALPGWTRAHVATHIARNGDALGRLAGWARTGERQDMYPSDDARTAEIEAGVGRPGLELQVDLDTSAERLTEAFAELDHAGRWSAQVETRSRQSFPARLLPLMRLGEVALHHVDLAVDRSVDAMDPSAALWLLQLAALRQSARPDYPRLTLQPEGSEPLDVGPPGDERAVVSGSPTALLGWVTRRRDASGLTGADGLGLPSYG